MAAVAELARRREAESHHLPFQARSTEHGPIDMVVDEVALTLTLTIASAGNWVGLAEDLAARLLDTGQALAEGRIDLPRARVISDGAAGLDDGLARRIEEYALQKAERQTTGQLRERIRRQVRKLDAEAAERRRRKAEQERRVDLSETPAGTAQLAGYDLPPDAASAAFNRISAIAHALAADGDQRRIDQLRADVFLALLRGRPLPNVDQAPDPSSPTPAAPEPVGGPDESAVAAAMPTGTVADQIANTIADTIAGILGKQPCRGAAALVAAAAQRMADAIADLRLRWCDAITRPGNHNENGHGHDGYRPPERMRRLVQTRDGRCAFPTCRRPAKHCDLDHTIPFHKGGTTCPCNLAPLCRRHHQVKQHHRWRVLQPWPGVIVWITPAGKWHITRPDRE
ncbi:MAG: DUF222 domain-containing protein [Streptosporangiales bacterium]|nr:DUF222 domain-containing protein [Streptosporangiales bacterium]